MVILLGIYLLNCYYGKSNNDVFAQKWFVSNKEFFMDNYAHVGIGTADNKESLILYNRIKLEKKVTIPISFMQVEEFTASPF